MNFVRILTICLACSVLALVSTGADAFELEQTLRELHAQYDEGTRPDYRVTQNDGGKSLSEAIDQVRRQTGGRILSAETKVSGGREVHHIKVLTEDGKVKTHKVRGHKRGG